MGYSTERVQVAFTNTNGAASMSGAFDSLVNLIPGSTRYYQWWYRSSLNSTCGSASNLSNGVIVHWQ
jgi:hypothetical protein